jgi:hypothetical protein
MIIRQADVPWPVHSPNLAVKLKDTANTSAPELSFQHKAVEEFHSHQAQVLQPAENDCPPPCALLTPDSQLQLPPLAGKVSTSQNKCSISSITNNDSDAGDNQPKPCTSSSHLSYFPTYSTINTAKKRHATMLSSQSITIDDLDFEVTDNNIHANGMTFPIFVNVY